MGTDEYLFGVPLWAKPIYDLAIEIDSSLDSGRSACIETDNDGRVLVIKFFKLISWTEDDSIRSLTSVFKFDIRNQGSSTVQFLQHKLQGPNEEVLIAEHDASDSDENSVSDRKLFGPPSQKESYLDPECFNEVGRLISGELNRLEKHYLKSMLFKSSREVFESMAAIEDSVRRLKMKAPNPELKIHEPGAP